MSERVRTLTVANYRIAWNTPRFYHKELAQSHAQGCEEHNVIIVLPTITMVPPKIDEFCERMMSETRKIYQMKASTQEGAAQGGFALGQKKGGVGGSHKGSLSYNLSVAKGLCSLQ